MAADPLLLTGAHGLPENKLAGTCATNLVNDGGTDAESDGLLEREKDPRTCVGGNALSDATRVDRAANSLKSNLPPGDPASCCPST